MICVADTPVRVQVFAKVLLENRQTMDLRSGRREQPAGSTGKESRGGIPSPCRDSTLSLFPQRHHRLNSHSPAPGYKARK